jgi:hypothetical protein
MGNSTKPDTLVAVRYTDIGCDQTEMFSREELTHRKGVEFISFGLLMVDTADKIVLATELCENGNYRGATTILRPLVREVTALGQWPPVAPRKRRSSAANRRAPAAVVSSLPPPIHLPDPHE